MFLFGITTFMFALGIIAMVLATILEFRLVMRLITGMPESPLIINCYYVWEIITCLMVRCTILSCHPLDPINGCSVYSMRYYVCLAHGGYLERRQAHHRHPCALHPWDHRHVKRSSQNRHSVLI
jgi:hypothetical protein